MREVPTGDLAKDGYRSEHAEENDETPAAPTRFFPIEDECPPDQEIDQEPNQWAGEASSEERPGSFHTLNTGGSTASGPWGTRWPKQSAAKRVSSMSKANHGELRIAAASAPGSVLLAVLSAGWGGAGGAPDAV